MSGQNTTVIPCGYVGPQELSATGLGCGTYSLNKRSNVPFVGLVGSSGFRKTISWGEIAEVPAGELITVQNQSFHGGDIFLNKGEDMCNRPSRITVPVPYEFTVSAELLLGLWAAKFPCDTRGAKRAYLMIDAATRDTAEGVTAFIRGRRLDGSMFTENVLEGMSAPFGPGIGFLSGISFLSDEVLSYIPLGQGAVMGFDTRPHNLLDAGDVFLLLSADTLPTTLIWPAEPVVRAVAPVPGNDAPSTWYVVEYD